MDMTISVEPSGARAFIWVGKTLTPQPGSGSGMTASTVKLSTELPMLVALNLYTTASPGATEPLLSAGLT